MGDHAGGVSAAGADGHPERVEHQLGLEVVAHRPADDPAAEDVLDGGEEEEALAGLDVLEVADPEPVRLRAGEVAVDEVRRRGPLRIADRRARPAPPAVGAAEPSWRISRATRFLPTADAVAEPQLGVDPRRAVDLLRLGVDLADPLGELAVGELARARRPRASRRRSPDG